MSKKSGDGASEEKILRRKGYNERKTEEKLTEKTNGRASL